MSQATDLTEVTQLILRERHGRDRGWWDRMRACYAANATVRLSWFRGSGEEFVARSREMAARGDIAWHGLAPPVVNLDRHARSPRCPRRSRYGPRSWASKST